MAFSDPYTNYLKRAYYLKKENSVEEVSSFIKLIESNPLLSAISNCSYFVLDYTTGKYILVKGEIENNTGHHPLDFLNGGLEYNIDNLVSSDFKIFSQQIFPKILEFLNKTPQENHKDYFFSINFRMFANNGNTICGLQKSKYITDPKSGLPLYCYGSWINISDYKKDSSIIHEIEHFKDGQVGIVEQTFYYPNPEEAQFTKREKEIVSWLAEGLSTKQIADKLFITESTITNHRVNMLRKSNTVNVAQLVAYAIRNKVI